MEEMYVFAAIGAVGALLRNLDRLSEIFADKKSFSKTLDETNWFLILKNVVLGGVAGFFFGQDYMTAAMAGLSGEWTLSKILKKARKK